MNPRSYLCVWVSVCIAFCGLFSPGSCLPGSTVRVDGQHSAQSDVLQACRHSRLETLRGGGILGAKQGDEQERARASWWPLRKRFRTVQHEDTVSHNSLKALHPYRKLFHVVSGYLFALLRCSISQKTFVEIFAGLGFGGIFGETLRINTVAFNKFFFALFGAFMREHEVNTHFSGMVFYLLGIAAAGSFDLFPAVIGIMMLAVGDPAAGIAGLLGQRALRNSPILPYLTVKNGKTILGSIGCWLACTVTTYQLLKTASWRVDPTMADVLRVSATVGGVTSIAELLIPSPPLVLPFKSFPLGLDDNICLPFIAAATAHVLLRDWKTTGSQPSKHIVCS